MLSFRYASYCYIKTIKKNGNDEIFTVIGPSILCTILKIDFSMKFIFNNFSIFCLSFYHSSVLHFATDAHTCDYMYFMMLFFSFLCSFCLLSTHTLSCSRKFLRNINMIWALPLDFIEIY